jgi:hypothetical protein
MKNYLITIIGTVDSKKMCQEIALSISPLVDSPNLKFQHKNGVLLFHFASEVSKSEIYDYMNGILFGVSEAFILTEITDNVSVSMNDEMFGHLFDLENVGDDISMRLEMDRVLKNEDFEEEELDEEFISTLLSQVNNIKKPTLDQILDKINTKGYNCLTPFERDTLENYSKN